MRSALRTGGSRSTARSIRSALAATALARPRIAAARTPILLAWATWSPWPRSRIWARWLRSSARSYWNAGRSCWMMRKPAGGWNMLSSAAGHASGPRAVRSRAARSTHVCAKASTSTSCTSNIDLLGPAACEKIGGDQGSIVPALLPNTGDQSMGGWIGQLVEPALECSGSRLGVEPGGADALMAEKALQVGNVHSEREQAGRPGMAQQVRVDALADCGPHRIVAAL